MWDFKREEVQQFEEIPAGDHRVIIESAEMAVSKASGNDMLVIKVRVSGYPSCLWSYIAFLEDRPEITNRMLTSLFDSFGIEDGNFNLASYVGKAGACRVKHDAEGRAKISYFIHKDKQGSLPPWKGDKPENVVKVEQEDDLPFDLF